MSHPLRHSLPLTVGALIAVLAHPAGADTGVRHTSTTVAHHTPRIVVIDRSRTGWWRGQPDFVAYHGPRPGYAYAPGYGYYAVTYRPPGGVWIVGSPYPASMRRYVVIHPSRYGLPAAPAGHGWYYAGNNFVLVRHSTWMVRRTVAGGW